MCIATKYNTVFTISLPANIDLGPFHTDDQIVATVKVRIVECIDWNGAFRTLVVVGHLVVP